MNKKRLVVISIDSLIEGDIELLKDMDNFKEIIENGCWVKKLESVYPTLTYPVHTSVLTGLYPKDHGIFHNEIMQINVDKQDWYWSEKYIKVETIIDSAKKANLKTAAIGWPVMGGSRADYTIPEIWTKDSNEEMLEILKENSSENLIDNVLKNNYKILNWKHQPNYDEFMVSCTEEIIKTYKPEVVFVHIALVDATRHLKGVHSDSIKEVLKLNDDWVGRIIQATKDIGVYEDTNFIIQGDHGHRDVNKVVCPNVILKEKGFIETDEDGKIINFKAYFHSSGLSAQLIIKKDKEKIESLLKEMVSDENLGIERYFNKEELINNFGLDGEFEFVLEGKEGVAFSNAVNGEIIKNIDSDDCKYSKATHGHMPNKGVQPTMVAFGPSIKNGQVFENGKIVDEANTFGKLLGIDFNPSSGLSINNILMGE